MPWLPIGAPHAQNPQNPLSTGPHLWVQCMGSQQNHYDNQIVLIVVRFVDVLVNLGRVKLHSAVCSLNWRSETKHNQSIILCRSETYLCTIMP